MTSLRVTLVLLLCTAGCAYFLWEQGREFYTLWHTQTQEYQAALHEYEQHRCRDTLATTTNRLIMTECQRLGAIVQTPPLSRTLVQFWYRVCEAYRHTTIRVAHSYVYKAIVFFTSLSVLYHAYRFYRVAYCRGDGVDALRARLTDDYLYGAWPIPSRDDYPADQDWY